MERRPENAGKMFTVTLCYVKFGEANITTAGGTFIEVRNFCCGSLRG